MRIKILHIFQHKCFIAKKFIFMHVAPKSQSRNGLGLGDWGDCKAPLFRAKRKRAYIAASPCFNLFFLVARGLATKNT